MSHTHLIINISSPFVSTGLCLNPFPTAAPCVPVSKLVLPVIPGGGAD